jgi:hypothetical protein
VRCADYRFWVKDPHPTEAYGDGGRQCRRYAPRPVNYRQLLVAARSEALADDRPFLEGEGLTWFHSLVQWPVTSDDDFCGDYSARVIELSRGTQ